MMKAKTNIYSLIRYTNIVNTIFGLKIVNIHQKHIKDISISFKLYSRIYSLVLALAMIYTAYLDVCIHSDTYHILSFTVALFFSQLSMLLVLSVIYVDNLFLGFHRVKEIYTLLIKIDEKLRFEKFQQKSDERLIVFSLYFTYILLKSYHIYFDFTTNVYYALPYHFCCLTLDLKFIMFSFEVNLVARRFELLNQYLISKCFNTEINMQDGIIIRIWRKNNKIVLRDNRFEEDCSSKLLSVYNELSRVIRKINSRYSSIFLMTGVYVICSLMSNVNPIILSYDENISKNNINIYRNLICWIIYHAIRLLIICTVCEILHYQADKTGTILSKLLIGNGTIWDKFAETVQFKSFRLRAEKIFILDYSFLLNMCVASISYSFIIMEMK